jgi:thiosulfate dehydrogenase [quinone] large subunit
MWLAVLPPKNNPFIDDHIIYIFVLQLLLQLHSGEVFGLGKWWNETSIVKKFSFLK